MDPKMLTAFTGCVAMTHFKQAGPCLFGQIFGINIVTETS